MGTEVDATPLELVKEVKIAALLGGKMSERHEASGIHFKDGFLYVVFDNDPYIVRLKPDLAPVWRQVGALYSELGQGEKAMRAYQRALSLGPESAEAWCGLAQAAAMAGDAAALDDARRSVAMLDPKAAARLTSWLESSAPRA